MKKVARNYVVNPQYFCEMVSGLFPLFYGDAKPEEEIKRFLSEMGIKVKSYNLNDLDKVMKEKNRVALVDCSHFQGDKYVTNYKWFTTEEKYEE